MPGVACCFFLTVKNNVDLILTMVKDPYTMSTKFS